MPDLLALMHERGYTPKKVSGSHGGEYCSPCPGPQCRGAGEDRFHIWPDRDSGGKVPGRFWCRRCGISGDTIAFLQQVDGMGFTEACAALGLTTTAVMPRRSRYESTPAMPRSGDAWTPQHSQDPNPRWQEVASRFLLDCQERLAGDAEVQAWLAARGISRDVAMAYGLGYNRSSSGGDRYRPRARWGLPPREKNGRAAKLWLPQGWVIPCYNASGDLVQLRIRRRSADIERFAENIKYLAVDGSSMATMVLHPDADVFVVVESGFDAVLLAGLFAGRIGAVTTWNASARPDARADALLSGCSLILGGLDYDQGGDREQPWWQRQYRQYRRLPALPGGAKDPGEAFWLGTDLYDWVVSALPRGLRIALGIGASQPTAHPVQPENLERPAAESGHVRIYETQVAGKRILICDDRETWQELRSRGEVVFCHDELLRLKTALAGLSEAERNAAILCTIEAKDVFCGQIVDGRAGHAGGADANC